MGACLHVGALRIAGDAGDEHHPMRVDRIGELQPAQRRCLTQRWQELLNRIVHRLTMGIGSLWRACGERYKQRLAVQFISSRAMGKAENQNVIDPFLEQGGQRVPMEGELPHDDISGDQRSLFGCHIDAVIRVEPVKTADFESDTALIGQIGQDGAIGQRCVKIGVARQDEDFAQASLQRLGVAITAR